MVITHLGCTPRIDASAYVAPNAMICGNVSIGKGSRILFGAQIIAENSSIVIGENCIVLENAVIRGTQGHPVSIGNHCLVGPHAHLAGCTVEDCVFIATGVSVFHGAVLQSGSEVSINGVVHLKTVLPRDTSVPIGWVAVGNPTQLFPPERHDDIWAVQKPLNFPLTVYGIERPTSGEPNNMRAICETMSDRLSALLQDVAEGE